MANIDTYLQQILAAIYGEEVRGSIHDAIEAINDQVDAAEETMEQFVQGAMDTTLTSTTKPAEGKAVGDALYAVRNILNNITEKQSAFIQTARDQTSNYYKTFDALSNGKCYLLRLTVETSGTYTLKTGTGSSSAQMVDTVGTCTVTAGIPYDFIGYIPSVSGLTVSRLSVATPYTLDIYEVVDLTGQSLKNSVSVRYLYDGTDVNDINTNSIYYVSATVSNVPNSQSAFFVETWLYNEAGTARVQIAYAWSGDNKGKRYFRTLVSNSWTQWVTFDEPHQSVITNGYEYTGDLNDINTNSIYYVSATVSNVPNSQSAFFVETWLYNEAGTARAQNAYAWSGDNKGKRYFRTLVSGSWTAWKEAPNATQLITNLTQYISQNAFSNTYQITTSPQITTDTNGWLQPGAANVDMTGAIMSMLQSTGYCHLAEGTFYVSGSIDMPESSTLEGCGKASVLRLMDSVENGYCVKIGSGNTIKNILFSGADNNTSPSTPNIGGRNAINYTSNADGNESTQEAVLTCIISGCFFKRFDGSGLYIHNTGGGVQESLIVSDCYFDRCEVGINIDYYGEYSKFSNVITYRCYYACINNGGNNVFASCTFHGTIGMLMDNSSGAKRNNGHGSAIGCTFNHIDNWNHPETLGGGPAVKAIGIDNGFIFSGCQIFYGGILLENCKGFSFSDCLIGGNSSYQPSIIASGSYAVFLFGCIFHGILPSISLPAGSKVIDCYFDQTGAQVTL